MWPNNELTEQLQISLPILQAPMGELSTPALAAAVSNAGGLGGLGMWAFSVKEAQQRILDFRKRSHGSLNVNYPLWEERKDAGGLAEEMESNLQALYDAKAKGPVPPPIFSESVVDPDHVTMLLNNKPEVISFHFGLPHQDVIQAIKAADIPIICSATTVAEAKTLEASGVDFIIAQGTEAGSHQGTFSGADPLNCAPHHNPRCQDQALE